MDDAIEILSVALLDEQRLRVEALKRLARALGLELGWHYLLDLTWILSQLGSVKGQRILDAGAGTGLIQWKLAEQGAEVFSVDRASRANLPARFRRRYRVTGVRMDDLLPIPPAGGGRPGWRARARNLAALFSPFRAPGRVVIYNQDLGSLSDLRDNSVDAVVSVSALEHNTPEALPGVVVELMRVLKPGGLLLATLGAARDADWFHEPSKGWCYTDNSLRRVFSLAPQADTNYAHYDELMASLRQCAELQENLAAFYARSGDNGMPWGKWDPRYQAVGVRKVKR
ncbi:MAG: class I SAM-dependent methyltransferase [Chloroflexi bacterium]|nr:class I SAM-dependent methyltransferase [Chloroflexota bacterium]